MREIEKELKELFPETTTYIHKGWIEKGEEALAALVKSDTFKDKFLTDALQWTAIDLQWDQLVSWLQRSLEVQKSNLAHYVLLWLATDKVHGFWRRQRDKGLDNPTSWERFSWALRARIGATSTLLAQIGEAPVLHGELILLFRNPLLFRLNPKGKLLPDEGIQYWEEQDGEWRRALDVLSYPITMKDILMIRETMVSVDRRISNLSARSFEEERWYELTEGKNIEALVMTIEKIEIFSLLPALVNAKEVRKYDSQEMLIAICSYLTDFWKKMTEFEILNHYFNCLIVHDEQGFGSDISFY